MDPPRIVFVAASWAVVLALAVLPVGALADGSDTDHDGIPDDLEDATARAVVAVAYPEYRDFEIRSTSQGASPNDVLTIRYKAGRVDAQYFANASQSVPSMSYRLRLKDLIEFTPSDTGEGISGGNIVRTVSLADVLASVPIRVSNLTTEDGERQTVFAIGPDAGPFSMALHVTNRFARVGGRLVTPVEVKVDFHIRNFVPQEGNGIAVLLAVESEYDTMLAETSHDENARYAVDEREMSVTAARNAMFFAWSNNATVDGVRRPVVVTPPAIASGSYEMYFVYGNGSNVDHDPKIGAVSQAFTAILNRPILLVPQGNLFLFVASITAFSAIVAVTAAWRRRRSGR